MADPTTSIFSLSALKPLAARVLEGALNQALALDEDTRRELATLDGRTLTLALESPPLAMQIQVNNARLRVGPVQADEPDLAIRSTFSGMLTGLRGALAARTGQSDAPAVAIGQGIAGDARLARELQRLVARFDPDWQRPFVTVFGEDLGPQLAGTLTAALHGMKNSGYTLAAGASGWLTGTSRLLVPRVEFDAFGDDVAVLDVAVARLAARVDALTARQHA